MKVTEFPIQGLKLIEPQAFRDARGFFTERFNLNRFMEVGVPADRFMQDNFSRSAHRVLRGLHYQYDLPQGKLVTALAGRILDVAVDIRRDSPTFGKSVSVELSGESPAWFWIPAGFAHGFVTLSQEGADVMYKVDAPYCPRGEGGLMWNDQDLAVEWPILDPLLSPRDEAQGKWSEYLKAPKF